MTDARRPRWKRKRWWTAAFIWLLLAYLLAFGPLAYLNRRGWLPGRYWLFLYWPSDRVFRNGLGETTCYHPYVRWWAELADEHRWGREE